MAKPTRAVDLEPLDRLEEKVRMLVATVDRMRAEQARVTEENLRLSRELETLQTRVSDADSASAEISGLREERELVRTRVAEMLEQLEALNL